MPDPGRAAASNVAAAVEHAYRDEWGQVVATLISMTRDWDLAEECVQDAFATAITAWTTSGVPERPGAWLTTTAKNLARDRLRRATLHDSKLAELGATTILDESAVSDSTDDRLRLIFTCCHPALGPESRVALTLRTLGGLTTKEISQALLRSESATAQTLVRAKHKITAAGIPYQVPDPDHLAERLDAVLAVLYLIYNQGYGSGPDGRILAEEGVRLARLLDMLMPNEPEVAGLLALMLLHEARRAGRTATGGLVPLEDQDRTRWDRALIDEGMATLARGVRHRRPGPYQLQAAIAACHADAPTVEDTDWVQIAELYDELAAAHPSPVVDLNRAVAVAMAEGPDRGLVLVDELVAAGDLDGYYLLWATRADLLRRRGDIAAARIDYQRAIPLAPTTIERNYLVERLAAADGGR